MKKLLLAFSLIAVFGLGITTASVTFPDSTSTVEQHDGDDKKKNKKCKKETPACCKKKSAEKSKSCCTKQKDKS